MALSSPIIRSFPVPDNVCVPVKVFDASLAISVPLYFALPVPFVTMFTSPFVYSLLIVYVVIPAHGKPTYALRVAPT